MLPRSDCDMSALTHHLLQQRHRCTRGTNPRDRNSSPARRTEAELSKRGNTFTEVLLFYCISIQLSCKRGHIFLAYMYYGTRQSYDDLKHATFLVLYRSNHSPDTLATSMPIPLLPPVTKQCFPFRVILEFVPSKARRRYQSARSAVPPPTIMVHTAEMRLLWLISIETIASILIATCFPARDLTRFPTSIICLSLSRNYTRARFPRA